ncbi:peptidylprolyl isomerase [filamentous cyanobacterium CCT1]|nr:peptidylprolyl isomerase [filamentous cyanobacterium CCT1]PSN79907.1 peptidylprolyl isomerase [filamentous cyanobacterium CCP4]
MTTPSTPDFSPVLHIGPQALTAADVVPLLRRYGLLPALVKELVVDQAIAAVDLTPEQTTEAIDQFLQLNQITSPEQRQTFLTQRGLSEADLALLAERTQKLRQYKLDTWGPKVESYFLQRKSHLDRVLYSLIRTREAGLAQELFFRIQDDGQPFADLARQYSEGQEAQTGGLIGPVELSVPHPALSRILAISQPGQLWPPTRVGEWFVVVRLEKFLPARLDDATRQRLIDELFNTWLQEQVQTALQANSHDSSLVEQE